MWQDYIFLVGQWIFIFALIPSVFGAHKPDVFTSFLTCIVLIAYAATFFSLELMWAAISTIVTAFLWAILAVQGVKYE